MKKLILASNNAGKLCEIESIIHPFGISLLSQQHFDIPEAQEDGLSFVENAIIKARHAAKYAQMPALADDSGLEIDLLQGEPGIYSARFAGETASSKDNMNKVLSLLEGIPLEKRTARFHCVMVLMDHATDPAPIITHGVWEGLIRLEPKGENGFGYDPIFYCQHYKQTAAQLAAEDKNLISHRGKALAELIALLQSSVTVTH